MSRNDFNRDWTFERENGAPIPVTLPHDAMIVEQRQQSTTAANGQIISAPECGGALWSAKRTGDGTTHRRPELAARAGFGECQRAELATCCSRPQTHVSIQCALL